MANTYGERDGDAVPGTGMFIVGVDVAPGTYVCYTPGDGYWLRYRSRGRDPVHGKQESGDASIVEIDPLDTAFVTYMPADWIRVGGPPETERTGRVRVGAKLQARLDPPDEDPDELDEPAARPRAKDAGSDEPAARRAKDADFDEPDESDEAYELDEPAARSTARDAKDVPQDPVSAEKAGDRAPKKVQKRSAVRPVLKPDIPANVRDAARAEPGFVTRARAGERFGTRKEDEGHKGLARLQLFGLVFMFVWGWAFLGWTLGFAVIVALFVLPRVLRGVFPSRAHKTYEQAKTHPGWFVVEGDYDEEARPLIVRTQRAIRRIRRADVYRGGLLDAAAGDAVLDWEEWEIASALAKVSELRQEQVRMNAQGSEVVKAALAPMRATLDTVVASVTSRIEALERYAAKVREADRLHRAHEDLRMLAERQDAYRELIAETVRDDLAKAELDRLTDNVENLRVAMENSLAAARDAATSLAADRPRPIDPAE